MGVSVALADEGYFPYTYAMSLSAALLPALLLRPAWADQRAVVLDAPVVETSQGGLENVVLPLDTRRLDPALSFQPLSPGAFETPNAQLTQTMSQSGRTLVAPPVLPQTAVQETRQVQTIERTTQKSQTTQAETQRTESLEQAALDAAIRFDKALDAGADGQGAVVWKLRYDPAKAADYRRAVDRARRSEWKEGFGEIQTAALAMYASAGVKAEPIAAKNRSGKDTPAVRVSPVQGVSSLNNLAYELKKSLGVDLDYAPERTQDAVAAFNGRERRILAPHLDRAEFHLSLLHEARHAYYSALLARGEVRLFHLMLVARPGRKVSPYAEAYANYLSLEELSTYPKTLKHLLSAIRDAEPGDKYTLELLARARVRHYLEFLGGALTFAAQVHALDKDGRLALKPLTREEADARQLDPFPGAYFQLDLPQAAVYLPFERGDSRTWLQKKLGKGDPLAAESLLLKARILEKLAEETMPLADAYREAVARGDFAEAGKQIDRLVSATAAADRDWRLGYAALLARER